MAHQRPMRYVIAPVAVWLALAEIWVLPAHSQTPAEPGAELSEQKLDELFDGAAKKPDFSEIPVTIAPPEPAPDGPAGEIGREPPLEESQPKTMLETGPGETGQDQENDQQEIAAQSLRDKTEYFEGLAESIRTPEGFLGPTGDSAIWTGIHAAAEAYRYAVTEDTQALASMEKSLWGLHALHEITGIPGLIARDIEPQSIADTKDPRVHPGHGKYEGYVWKGNLSFDQYLGYLYGISEAWPYIQDPELRSLLREDVRQIAMHFMRHGGKIQALDTYLDFSPQWYYEERWPWWLRWLRWVRYLLPKRGGNVMHGLHLMKVAAYVTEDPAIEDYYQRVLIDQKNYDSVVRDHNGGTTDQSVRRWEPLLAAAAKIKYGSDVTVTADSVRGNVGMNLGHIALYNLSRLEKDPRIRRSYLKALQDTHRPAARHSNTYWNFLAVSQLGGDAYAVSEGIESLEKLPTPYGPRINSRDASIPKYKGLSTSFFKSARGWDWFAYDPIPLEKRPCHTFTWQHNAVQLDGSCKKNGFGGTAYLVAYWMGRRYGFIGPEQ